MNRRTALFASLLLGNLFGRVAEGRQDERFRPPPDDEGFGDPDFDPLPPDATPRPVRQQVAAGDLMLQPDHVLRAFDIRRYVELPHSPKTERPEAALVEWIFRKTGSEAWHGADRAMLSATRDQLIAYHNRDVLDEVTEVWERFTKALFDIFDLRVRIIAASNPGWRGLVFHRLEPVRLGRDGAGGPQGQQAWFAEPDEIEDMLLVLATETNYRTLFDQHYDVVNGQTLLVYPFQKRNYVSGIRRDSTVALGFEPRYDALVEGVELRVSPLLNYDGTAIDLATQLEGTVLRRKLRTRVVAPRQIGPAEMDVEIPEVAHTRLNQTIPEWPLNRVLVLSAGILPGILDPNRGGLLNLGASNQTELLVLISANTRMGTARRDRERR